MSDYQPVQKALADGADPSMLCATCPWDRTCVTPPTMTRAEIDAQIKEASVQDKAHAAAATASSGDADLPVGTLLAAAIYAGRDTAAQVCPVFALRLRSSSGRSIADSLKTSMQEWDDQS